MVDLSNEQMEQQRRHEQATEKTVEREKPYHHGDLRRALISAALDLLEEEGSAAIELRKVARKAGVSHAAPYRHFEDRRALMAAVAEEGFTMLSERMKVELERSENHKNDSILTIALVYVQFALEKPGLVREMYSGLTIDRAAYSSLHQASKVAFSILIGAIQDGQANGAIIPGNPDQIAIIIWSMVHGIAMLLLEKQITQMEMQGQGVDQFVAHCINHLYLGVRPR